MQFVNLSVQAFMAGVLQDNCTIWDHTFVLTFGGMSDLHLLSGRQVQVDVVN